MFYSNKSSILVSGEGNSSRSKMTSFMRILNLKRILFLMCIVSSWEITWGMKEELKDKIKVEKLESGDKGQPDFTYKVTFLGDDQVGKTQIINQHVNGSLDGTIISTIGIDFKTQKYKSTINVDNSQTILLQIWDTAGRETYRLMSLNCTQDARAIVLVYDITKPDSFKHIDSWLENAPKDAVYFLVGNKTDLNGRQIQTAVAEQYAKEKNMQFFEVSAMKGDNVDKLFEDIVKECLIKEEDIKEEVIKEEVIRNDIKDYKQENKKNIQSPTHTNNKPCICCSCCPCNK